MVDFLDRKEIEMVFKICVAERGGWKDIAVTQVRVGDEVEVPSGSGGYVRVQLFVPPGHELEGQTHIKVPSKIIRREEDSFGVTRHHLVKIPEAMRGAELLIKVYDLVGDQVRYFYKEVLSIIE